MLLAFDTAGVDRTTVTLRLSDGSVHGESLSESPAECLVPLTQQVLGAAAVTLADVQQLAVGVGPGPYTGLRIGLAHAHALSHVLAVPLLGVSSLAAVAATVADPPGRYLVATDARRKEVFSALVVGGELQMESIAVGPAQQLCEQFPGVPVVGDGLQRYADVFNAAGCMSLASDIDFATALAKVAHAALSTGGLRPFPQYLREPDAVPATSAKSVLS